MCKLYYTGNVIPVDCIITIILKYGEKHRSLNHKPTRVYHINNLHTRGGGAWNIIPGDIKNRKKKLCTEIECVAGIVVSFVKCDLGMGEKKKKIKITTASLHEEKSRGTAGPRNRWGTLGDR